MSTATQDPRNQKVREQDREMIQSISGHHASIREVSLVLRCEFRRRLSPATVARVLDEMKLHGVIGPVKRNERVHNAIDTVRRLRQRRRFSVIQACVSQLLAWQRDGQSLRKMREQLRSRYRVQVSTSAIWRALLRATKSNHSTSRRPR